MSRLKRGHACILVSCQDRPGIVAAVTTFLFERGANIVELDQHTSMPDGAYFMRVEFDAPPEGLAQIQTEFTSVAARFEMNWRIALTAHPKRVVIFVSKEDHCLMELLWQWRSGALPVEITAVISNHADLGDMVRSFDLPFHHIPVEPDTKAQAEAQALAIMGDQVDLIVLARYMQILSGAFVDRFP